MANWVGDFECDYVEYSWSVNCVDWLRFGHRFVRGIMTIPEEGFPLRLFVDENDLDRHGNHPLYEAIVLKARKQGTAGRYCASRCDGFGNIAS